jgi:hypothetical protein
MSWHYLSLAVVLASFGALGVPQAAAQAHGGIAVIQGSHELNQSHKRKRPRQSCWSEGGWTCCSTPQGDWCRPPQPVRSRPRS